MTPDQREKFGEIQRLLKEAYDHWQKFSDDHHSKSGEGWVRISYPTFWEQLDGSNYLEASIIEIYSYVFGSSRMHTFHDFYDALITVRNWHKTEMEEDYAKSKS